MTLETALTLLTALMGVATAILLAGIPWAYGIHGRLMKIETTLSDHLAGSQSLPTLEHRVTRLETHWELCHEDQ
jgi:hypothetical protein